jgi:hypothetical protein
MSSVIPKKKSEEQIPISYCFYTKRVNPASTCRDGSKGPRGHQRVNDHPGLHNACLHRVGAHRTPMGFFSRSFPKSIFLVYNSEIILLTKVGLGL